MSDFLKTIGQGILYLIFSPFILLGVALYAIYAFLLFFVMFFKRIILFFKGENMKDNELSWDKAARMHLNNQDEVLEKKQQALEDSINVPATNLIKEEKTTIVQPIIITQTVDEYGNIKNVSYVNPQPQIPQNQKIADIEAIEEQKLPELEHSREEERYDD